LMGLFMGLFCRPLLAASS